MPTREWIEGFAAGFSAGQMHGQDSSVVATDYFNLSPAQRSVQRGTAAMRLANRKPKRKQSGKQKILTQMAKKAWDKYKKGNGKKSYIDIRAQVSRSASYKKKTKGM